ncbi:MAG: hypothetical protein EHM43_07295 [Ignavibacteriae bacterium]|nr:MAG: hypothetical protein EHM43_07295 [Ignavibacteriota bacterium]
MRSRCLLILLTLCCTVPMSAQWMFMKADGDSLVRRGIDAIYNVEFQEAERCFSQVRALYPEHPAGYFMDAMVDWWRITLDRRRFHVDEQFKAKVDKVIAVCDKLLENEPRNVTALFFKGGALGFRGRYYATRGEFLDAANTGKEALDILTECQKIAPGNHDIMLGTGIYNYFAAVLPEEYPLLKPVMMFLPSGDRKIGLLQLKAAGNKAQYAAVEAKVVLITALYTYEKNVREAYVYAKELATKYPNNPSFQRSLGRCLVQLGPLDTMEALWRQVLLRYMDKWVGYDELAAREALYYIGVSRMISGDLDLALKYFYKCDEACRLVDEDPSGFMVKLNLKIGQIYDLQGKRQYAVKQYAKVVSWKDYGGTQAEAESYLQKPYTR